MGRPRPLTSWVSSRWSKVMQIAIVAPGNMGAAVARRLHEHGVEVLTTLEGRGPASAARARSAGMTVVPFDRLCEARFVLSILPSASALDFARAIAPQLSATERKPLFV